MKLATLPLLLGSALLLPACLDDGVTVGESQQAMEGDMGGGMHNCPGPSPVMLSGDFDGSGVVDEGDLHMLNEFRESGDYAAFFDMNVDGALDGRDVALVAQNNQQAAHPRDAQMAALWRTTLPYRNIANAYGAGYVPFTPDLKGHGIHFANFNLIYSWRERGGFQPHQPEGLNYTADGRLVAAFYYAPAAIDLAEYGFPAPLYTYYRALDVPPSFASMMPHEWHHHVGPCFGGNTSPVPGFDQCMTRHECYMGAGGQLWSPEFHMLHVWLFELNACGPFGGIDEDISPTAPPEPNHGMCELPDVVPCVVVGFHPNGAPMCAESDGGDHMH